MCILGGWEVGMESSSPRFNSHKWDDGCLQHQKNMCVPYMKDTTLYLYIFLRVSLTGWVFLVKEPLFLRGHKNNFIDTLGVRLYS